MEDKELAKKQQAGALALSDYEGDTGAGFENVSQADTSIPFLKLLQTGSPEVKPKDEGYVKGAVAGMMMNSVTKELYDGDQGMIVIPTLSKHCFVEWVPRDKGGGDGSGFKGMLEVTDERIVEARRVAKDQYELKSKDGNDYTETFYIYGMLHRCKVDLSKEKPASVADLIDLDSMGFPIVISHNSTKIKPYKGAMTALNMFNLPDLPHPQNKPPLWAFPLHYRTAYEKRDAGDSYNYRIGFAFGQIKPELLLPRWKVRGQEEWKAYSAAREFKDVVRSGQANINYNNDKNDSSRGGGSATTRPASGQKQGEDDIPF